jgi:hypothetical protein|tara:strand:+ start:3463 stop:3948 length:486 start_codon:yes stop_codon:yes gene_type:complete
MAYQKLQAYRAIPVIPSDVVNIPNPAAGQITGTTTATTTNKLVNSAAKFLTSVPPGELIRVGFTVVNTTDNTTATVSAVDSETTLSLSADIMASGESYIIYGEATSEGCVLYCGTAGNINVVTAGGDQITFSGVNTGAFVPVQVLRVNSTGTSASNIVALW